MPTWREDALRGAAFGGLIFLGTALLVAASYWFWVTRAHKGRAPVRGAIGGGHSLRYHHVLGTVGELGVGN